MKFLLATLFILGLSFTSHAKYRQVCVVKYATEYGWSKKYTVEVTFLSGYELNTATNSFRYSIYSVYAVIFWGEGQATVIKLSSYLLCSSEVDRSCIRSSIYDLKGKDQDGDEWSLCVNGYCL